jgi:hypothetical protein
MFCADNVEFAKKLVAQNGTVPPLVVAISVKTLGMILRIFPDVVFGAAEKLEPMLICLLTSKSSDIFTFATVIDVVKMLGAVILVALTLTKLDVELTNKLPVLRLLLLTVPRIEIPDICRDEEDILVDLTLVESKLVVVCVVLLTSGTIKLVLTCILPVLKLLLLTVPKIDIFDTRKFDIVDVVIEALFNVAIELEWILPVLKLTLPTEPRLTIFETCKLDELILVDFRLDIVELVLIKFVLFMLETVLLVIVVFCRLVVLLTDKVPVLRLFADTVDNILVPDIFNVELEIF